MRGSRQWETERVRAVAAGLVAAGFSLLYQSPGVVLTPDGWAYWEGSVSLLAGEGLRYLGGQPLVAWPPLFPTYLALWQTVLGVSAGTLAVAQACALGLAASLLVAAAERLCAHQATWVFRWSLVLVLALVPAIALRAVLSESLFAAFLGGALLVAARVKSSVAGDREYRWEAARRTALFAGLVAGLVLTRHQGLALVPGLAWLFARRALEDSRRARVMTVALLAIAGAAWLAARIVLGQLGSHRLMEFDEALFGRVVATTSANLSGAWALVAPSSLQGVIAVAFVVVALTIAQRRSAASVPISDPASRDSRGGLTAAAASSSLLTLALLAMTGMEGSRFMLPLVLLLLVLLPSRATLARRVWARRAVVVFTLVIAAIQVWRGVRWANHVALVGPVGVRWSAELTASCIGDPGCQQRPDTVSPPDYPWVDREWSRRHSRER